MPDPFDFSTLVDEAPGTDSGRDDSSSLDAGATTNEPGGEPTDGGAPVTSEGAPPDGGEPTSPVTPPAAAPVPSPPSPPPAVVAQPPDQQVVEPPAAPPAQPQPPAPPPVQPPAQPQPPFDPAAFAAARATERAKVKASIAGSFQLSQEQRDAWALEPEKVVPELIAEAQLQTYEMVFNTIYGLLPSLIGQHLQVHAAQASGEQEFFSKFPALKDADRSVLMQYGRAYRQANPQATREQFITAVGTMVSHALGKPLPGAAPAPPPPSAPVARPPVPLRGASVPAGGQPPTVNQPNIWTELVMSPD